MLFNSTEFLFVFLPLTLAGFYFLGARSRAWAVRWVIFASIVFYAWWRPLNVLIIAPSIIINFALAKMLLRLNEGEGSPHDLWDIKDFKQSCGLDFHSDVCCSFLPEYASHLGPLRASAWCEATGR